MDQKDEELQDYVDHELNLENSEKKIDIEETESFNENEGVTNDEVAKEETKEEDEYKNVPHLSFLQTFLLFLNFGANAFGGYFYFY
jgi:hypothetical protein